MTIQKESEHQRLGRRGVQKNLKTKQCHVDLVMFSVQFCNNNNADRETELHAVRDKLPRFHTGFKNVVILGLK